MSIPIQTNMTIKGQVTIPRDVRKAVGLVPGQPVEVAVNDRGEAVVRPVDAEVARARKMAEVDAGIREAQRIFRAQNRMPGYTSDEWYRLMRGDPPEV
jgi:antitoxin PrlF